MKNQRNIELFKDKKVMMITFDDGPDEINTSLLLDELSKLDVRVTFFVIGKKIVDHPDIVLRAYNEGHTIANHTYNHKDFTKLEEAEILTEVNDTNRILNDLLGINNKYLRLPFGKYNNHILKFLDMSIIHWNIDTADWEHKNAQKTYEHIISRAKDGSIVLAHDLYTSTIKGVLLAIDYLLKQGYALISLEEAEKLGYINNDISRKYVL